MREEQKAEENKTESINYHTLQLYATQHTKYNTAVNIMQPNVQTRQYFVYFTSVRGW